MATEEDIYKMIFALEGAEKADDLRAKIALAEQKIASMWSTMKQQPAQFQAAIKQTAADLVDLKQKLEEADKAAAGLGGGARNNGRALLEFSRAAEDAQYGVAGVVNNIPGLVSALGGASGLVGVISLVVIAAAQLYKHWDDLLGLFGNGKTLSEAKAMEELGKQTKLTADEAERLARYQAVEAKSKEIREALTKDQKKTADAVTEAIVEAGQKDVVAGMLKADPAAFDAAIPGIEGKDGKLLQNDQGENRTALTDARDAAQKVEDYKSGKSRRVVSAKGETVVEEARPEELQRLQIEAGEAQKKLDEARKQAGLRQLSTNALPQLYPENLDKEIKKIEADPKYLANLGEDKRAKLLQGYKDATPEGRKKNDQIDVDADRAWDDLQESIKSVKEWSKDFKDKVKAALKDRTFLGHDESKDTPAEKQARKKYNEREGKVAASLTKKDFLDENGDVKDKSELTDDQQEAARRFQRDKAQEAKDKAAGEKRSNAAKKMVEKDENRNPFGEAELEMEFLQGMFGGKSPDEMRKGLTDRLKKQFQDKNPDLNDEDATDLAEKRVDRASKGVAKELMEGQEGKQKGLEIYGAQDFAGKVAGGFNYQDPIPKNQLQMLENIYKQLKDNPIVIQNMLAQFSE